MKGAPDKSGRAVVNGAGQVSLTHQSARIAESHDAEIKTLALRCEQADAGPQGSLIEAAWELVAPTFSRDELNRKGHHFGRCMDAGAWLDAALMLVPDDCGFIIYGQAAKVGRCISGASTPALALCAASLRERSTK